MDKKVKEFLGLSWDNARHLAEHQLEKGLAKSAEVELQKPADLRWGVEALYKVKVELP